MTSIPDHPPTATRVVHVGDNVEGAVYIGRYNRWKKLDHSVLSNPYKIGERYLWLNGPATRQDVIDSYRTRLTESCRFLYRHLPELRGKPLACWCRHDGEEVNADNLCHGDVLIELLDAYTDEELVRMAVK